jgi:hypothetical protein
MLSFSQNWHSPSRGDSSSRVIRALSFLNCNWPICSAGEFFLGLGTPFFFWFEVLLERHSSPGILGRPDPLSEKLVPDWASFLAGGGLAKRAGNSSWQWKGGEAVSPSEIGKWLRSACP